MEPIAAMMHWVREGARPHLTLTLAVLCMQLHSDPAVLSAQTSMHISPCSVSLHCSLSSTHGAEGLVVLTCGFAHAAGSLGRVESMDN